MSLRQTASRLFPICYNVEKKIVGYPDDASCQIWAKANALRHAHTVEAIDAYAQKTGKKSLSILNASGLACGHQDFSIAHELSQRYKVKWTVFESPKSPYLVEKNKTLEKYLKDLKIELVLSNFKNAKSLYGTGKYDVILFTEIAEHLDHTTFLESLAAMRRRLTDDGILILTTPNVANLINRIKLLFGNGDFTYWGEGQENLEAGLWGHIVYYDLNRLKRLLLDAGLQTQSAYTFWYNKGKVSILGYILYGLSFIVPRAKQTHFIVATKTESQPVPFHI
jgi:2-polyprenyl-3-methyl-5-hydroxy-6-metoxy-1,4-benzoquinol methylase